MGFNSGFKGLNWFSELSAIVLHVSDAWGSNFGADSPSRGTNFILSHRSTVKMLRRIK